MPMCFSKNPVSGTRTYKNYEPSDLRGLVLNGVVGAIDPNENYDSEASFSYPDPGYVEDPYDGAY